MNKIVLLGQIIKDPELKVIEGLDRPCTRLVIAVERAFRSSDGTIKSDFIPITFWGKKAEIVAQYLKKGDYISLSGRLRTGSYEAQDGTRRYTTDVVVESFDFIDSGNGGARGNSGFGSGNDFGGSFGMPDNSFSDSSFNSNDDMTPIDDGDIPF